MQSRVVPVEEAIYHRDCDKNFRAGKNIRVSFTNEGETPPKKQKLGSPKSMIKMSAFEIATQYLEENDEETITLNDLHHIIKKQEVD